MKYFKKLKIYKINNCTFNPETIEAHSYKWWRFVAKIDGVVIFNSYYFSPTTSKHQSKVKALLNELGIKIDIEAPFSRGINGQDLAALYLEAEETLCDLFLKGEAKTIERNEKAKLRRIKKALDVFKPEASPAFNEAVNLFLVKE